MCGDHGHARTLEAHTDVPCFAGGEGADVADDFAGRVDHDARLARLQLRNALPPDLTADQDPVGAVLSDLCPLRVRQRVEGVGFAVLLQGDLKILQIGPRRLDGHLERCRQAHELFGLVDLDGGGAELARIDEDTGSGKERHQNERKQKTHRQMITAGWAGCPLAG